MFIHIWMHWFWITEAYLRGFLIFAVHSIFLAEAGLLNNDTFAPPTAPDSSQTNRPTDLFSPPPLTLHHANHSLHTTPSIPNSSTSRMDPTTFATAPPSTSDFLDALQYPHKKSPKYTHPKKPLKVKGKPPEDALGDVNIVEENLNVNITITGEGTGLSAPEVVNPHALPTSEIPPSDASAITTSLAPGEETAEVVFRLEPSLAPTEEHKDVEMLKNDTLVIESKVEESGSYSTVEPFLAKKRLAAATSGHKQEVEQSELNPGSITGITLGVLVVFSLFGAVSFVLYRKRYLNKPEVLHDKCSNLDSSGYIDETSLRENSEEMYSLDNDSFLNSLEAMTIQNYWTESVKHTKL